MHDSSFVPHAVPSTSSSELPNGNENRDIGNSIGVLFIAMVKNLNNSLNSESSSFKKESQTEYIDMVPYDTIHIILSPCNLNTSLFESNEFRLKLTAAGSGTSHLGHCGNAEALTTLPTEGGQFAESFQFRSCANMIYINSDIILEELFEESVEYICRSVGNHNFDGSDVSTLKDSTAFWLRSLYEATVGLWLGRETHRVSRGQQYSSFNI